MIEIDRFTVKRKVKNKDWYVWDREEEHMVLLTSDVKLAYYLLESVDEYYAAQMQEESGELDGEDS